MSAPPTDDDFPTPTHVGQITPEWLTAVVGDALDNAVEALRLEPIGTGQVADSYRLHLDWRDPSSAPATLVAKTSAADAASRQAARLTRTYEIEVGFYRHLAASVGANVPTCWHAAYDVDSLGYVVLLDDVAPARQGDQLHGCSPSEAKAALGEAALLHASHWDDPSLPEHEWLVHSDADLDGLAAVFAMFVPTFVDRYGPVANPNTIDTVRRLQTDMRAYLDRPRTQALVHRDFRVDNLLFGADRVVVLDWQTAAIGPALSDVAYFLGGSLTVDDRRAHEEALVRGYHEALLAAGGDLGWDESWWGYRRYALDGLAMAVLASSVVGSTERGDAMFVAMADRSAQHAVDLDTWSLVDA